MLAELRSNGLEVQKVPSRRETSTGFAEGYIRVAVSSNCEWYRRFCKGYVRQRGRSPKFRTYIKRCCTIDALNRMIAGDRETIYAKRLMEVVEELIREMA